jgi:hypothetical protein
VTCKSAFTDSAKWKWKKRRKESYGAQPVKNRKSAAKKKSKKNKKINFFANQPSATRKCDFSPPNAWKRKNPRWRVQRG